MKEEVIEHLKTEYKKLEIKSKKACLKYSYLFNKVSVNIYFDNYDKDLPSITLILKFEKVCYFRTFNFEYSRYLENIPIEILNKLLDNNTLEEFYDTLEEKLMKEYCIASYQKDYLYKENVKLQEKICKINPFVFYLRKPPMTEEQKSLLNTYLNIPKETLNYIQKKGFTIATTDDIEKKIKLKDAMGKVEI